MADQEVVKEIKYKNVTVRMHFPDDAKEERRERIKKATEVFLKKALMQKRK